MFFWTSELRTRPQQPSEGSGVGGLTDVLVSSHLDLLHERTKLKENVEQMIKDRRRMIEEIQRSVVVSRNSAERHISDSQRTFQNLLQDISTSRDRLAANIEEQRQSTQQQAVDLTQELQWEIQQLTKTRKELEQPSAPTGSQQPLPSIPATRELAGVSVSLPTYGREVVSIFNKLEEKMSQEKKKLIAKAKLLRAQEFFKDVTMDPDTANEFLVLSADRKRVHVGDIRQNLPENPKRFNKACNVLGRPSCSSGRFYFQVQVEGLASWDVGVVRGSVCRTGSITASTDNGFWTICLRDASKYKAHKQRLQPRQPPKKVGVFVDYEDACVSFFDVNSADLIHQFTRCSFSEQLWPFFSPGCQRGDNGPHFLVICPIEHDLRP